MATNLVVAKFGGTSMADANAMLRSANVVKRFSDIKIVVVSATSGTTNKLLELANKCSEKSGPSDIEVIEKLLEELQNKHLAIAKDLNALTILQRPIEELIMEARVVGNTLNKGHVPGSSSYLRQQDRLVSVGERLSALLFTEALKLVELSSKHFDARFVIKTDSDYSQARPQINEIEQECATHLLPLLKTKTIIVTEGFIGSNSMGNTTTLGRGGSDYTASLIGAAVNASLIQIWTDVAGIMTMDPRLVKNAHYIDKMNFSEASELANFGAKVLHPLTLEPAMNKNIEVFVGSSYEPELPGTRIFAKTNEAPLVRAIAMRKNQVLLTVSSNQMLNTHGFLAKVFSLFEKYKTSVDLVTTSEVSVAITLDGAQNGTSLGTESASWVNQKLIQELSLLGQVVLEDNLTLVALVGNNMAHTKGLSAKAFSSICDFNVRLLCHGASSHNLCFLVNSKEALEVVTRLHKTFLEH